MLSKARAGKMMKTSRSFMREPLGLLSKQQMYANQA